MTTLVKHIKIGEIIVVSPCKNVPWFFARFLYIGWTNPFNPKVIVNPWFSIIPAGGFHFLGLRVTWFEGPEIEEKRINNL